MTGRRIRTAARVAAGALLFAGAVAAAPTQALDTTVFRANYVIAVGGIVVGHASAQSRFTDSGLHRSVSGSTSGVSRIVSDASARLSGSGRISGGRVLPSSYILDTRENGFVTHVTMGMRGGRLTALVAMPRLAMAPDRVPLTPTHKTNVVDPIGAFIVLRPAGHPLPADRLPHHQDLRRLDPSASSSTTRRPRRLTAATTCMPAVIVCGAR